MKPSPAIARSSLRLCASESGHTLVNLGSLHWVERQPECSYQSKTYDDYTMLGWLRQQRESRRLDLSQAGANGLLRSDQLVNDRSRSVSLRLISAQEGMVDGETKGVEGFGTSEAFVPRDPGEATRPGRYWR